MKVAIVGYGFIGKALCNGLKDVEVLKIDPKLNTSVYDLNTFKPEIIFICVPTPMVDNNDQDISIVKSVVQELNYNNSNALIVLKSTILPKYIEELTNLTDNLVLNPEFLREMYSDEDFINSPLILFGGDSVKCKKISYFYKNFTNCIEDNHICTDVISASLIKYSINSFLATKVVFFNQLQEIFNKSEANESWKNFIKYLSIDPRMGATHMDVPGPDNRYGFGGACFPKDTHALYEYSKEIKADFGLLKEVILINNKIRSSYEQETDREKEQNIKFKT